MLFLRLVAVVVKWDRLHFELIFFKISIMAHSSSSSNTVKSEYEYAQT